MAACENMRRLPSLAIIRGLMRRLEECRECREFCHSRPGDILRAPPYLEIRDDVSHHREIDAELQALGYKYQW